MKSDKNEDSSEEIKKTADIKIKLQKDSEIQAQKQE